ncbi:uncharacterized protein PAN0_013d4754 [Moesziomyces antarcticus]|uniref:Uncharacterized protein n=2 Tax=Pseudozyma antarctica TaxID=84753 RepID=A0A081CIN6_PSEA2|nr:uncharacterized protein PAN0_013d4754 [Moesziomyces antarcticus]GAK66532.1 hypothetical protein PAN0_013d4754 [Moesziomyces antarcticus]SPO47578.1 uncharacterized protein PSANT_05266 [Moesziomyces antarcticus]
MDPAFSLADELSGAHTLDSLGELDAHYTTLDEFETYDVGSLGDELGQLDLDPGLHLRSGSLADELEPASNSNVAEEVLDQDYASNLGGGSLQAAAAQTEQIQESITATHAFLARLSSLSTQGHDEDTAPLEVAAAGYLKLVSECTVEREAQLRELRDLDRKLARDLAATHTHHRSASLDSIDSEATIREEEGLDGGMFAPVYASTSALVGSLGSLHEHTQVTKSSTADAQRRLKSLRTLLAQWNADHESTQHSLDWIATHSPHHQAGETAHSQLDYCRKRLDDAQMTATQLLTPQRIPA